MTTLHDQWTALYTAGRVRWMPGMLTYDYARMVDVEAATNGVQMPVAYYCGIIICYGPTTITPDFALANNFSVTLGGNRTLANPTNLTAGQSGVIVITQDGTGSRTLAYGSNFKFPGGTAPTLTTTAAAVDVLAYYVESASRITARLVGDVK
jgi:hypothetical protein